MFTKKTQLKNSVKINSAIIFSELYSSIVEDNQAVWMSYSLSLCLLMDHTKVYIELIQESKINSYYIIFKAKHLIFKKLCSAKIYWTTFVLCQTVPVRSEGCLTKCLLQYQLLSNCPFKGVILSLFTSYESSNIYFIINTNKYSFY